MVSLIYLKLIEELTSLNQALIAMKLSIVSIESGDNTSRIGVLRETPQSKGLKGADRFAHLMSRLTFAGFADWDSSISVLVNNEYRGTGKAVNVLDLLDGFETQLNKRSNAFEEFLNPITGGVYDPSMSEDLIGLLQEQGMSPLALSLKLRGLLPIVETNGAMFYVAAPIKGNKGNVVANGYVSARISFGLEYSMDSCLNDLFHTVDREKEEGQPSTLTVEERAKRMSLSLQSKDYNGNNVAELTLIDVFGEAVCREAESKIADVIKTQMELATATPTTSSRKRVVAELLD